MAVNALSASKNKNKNKFNKLKFTAIPQEKDRESYILLR